MVFREATYEEMTRIRPFAQEREIYSLDTRVSNNVMVSGVYLML